MTLVGVLGTLGVMGGVVAILVGLDAWDRWMWKDDPMWGWIYQSPRPKRKRHNDGGGNHGG